MVRAVIEVMLTKRLPAAALILVSSIAVALLATRPPSPLAAAERLVQAVAFQVLAPGHPANSNVVVIGITEETLSAFPYRSPIDRGFLASLIDRLATDGVAAIGLDVVLDRPTEAAKDAALRRALLRTDIPVVAISVAPDTAMPAERRRRLTAFLDGVRTGDANLARDRFDDMVREHVPVHPTTGQPSFPAAIAAALAVAVPTRPFPIAWWRRTRGATAVPMYPAESIGMLPPGWLTGKVALIGSLVAGSDEHRTLNAAFGTPSFGVDIHAQVVSQLLSGRAVPAPALPWPDIAATSGMAVAGLVVGSVWAGVLAVAGIGVVGLGFAVAALAGYALSGDVDPDRRAGAGAADRRWGGAGLARPGRPARSSGVAGAVLTFRQRTRGRPDHARARPVHVRWAAAAAGTDRDGAVCGRRRLHRHLRVAGTGAADRLARSLHRYDGGADHGA